LEMENITECLIGVDSPTPTSNWTSIVKFNSITKSVSVSYWDFEKHIHFQQSEILRIEGDY